MFTHNGNVMKTLPRAVNRWGHSNIMNYSIAVNHDNIQCVITTKKVVEDLNNYSLANVDSPIHTNVGPTY